jgi:hypothetical protein
MGLNPLVPDVFLESVCHLLWDENMFPIFTAFRVPQRQFPVVDVHRSQFQDLAHPHAATGHQFKHKAVPQFFGCKDDFVDDVFFDDFPRNHGPGPEHLPEHWAIAGAPKIRVDIASDEVEEGGEVGVLDAFGLLSLTFGDFVQEYKDFVSGDGFDAPSPKILAESGEKQLI